MLAASCCHFLEHSRLTRLSFKASDSHSGLLRADLTSEHSCSVHFLSWDAHREIYPYTNKQQNQVWHQLPFHISLLMVVWLCQPSPTWKDPCPFTTDTLNHETVKVGKDLEDHQAHPALPRPPRHHVSKCHIHTPFKGR